MSRAHRVIDDHCRLAVAPLVAEGEAAKAAVRVVSGAIVPRSAHGAGTFGPTALTPVRRTMGSEGAR